MKKWIIGTIECIATIFVIGGIAGIMSDLLGLDKLQKAFPMLATALILLVWSFFKYKKEKHYKFIAYSVGAILNIIIVIIISIFMTIDINSKNTNDTKPENNKMVSVEDIFSEEAIKTICTFEGSPVVIVKGAFGGTLIEIFEAIKSKNIEYVFITGYQDRISGEGSDEPVITSLDDCKGFNTFLSLAKSKGGAIISYPNGNKNFINTENK